MYRNALYEQKSKTGKKKIQPATFFIRYVFIFQPIKGVICHQKSNFYCLSDKLKSNLKLFDLISNGSKFLKKCSTYIIVI